MNGKTILEHSCPATQSREAVASLIAYINHGKELSDLPDFYRLAAEMVLVKSNKGDVYYVVTPKACSCPSAMYRPGKPCKHQRKYFQAQKPEAANHVGELRPDMRGFRPVSLLPGEVEA